METGFSLNRYEACIYLPLVSLITKLLKMIAGENSKFRLLCGTL